MNFNDRRKAKPSMAPSMASDRMSYKVSDNVTVKPGNPKRLGNEGPLTNDRLGLFGQGPRALAGASQAVRENRKTKTPLSRKESKANAKGLKAANAPSLRPSMERAIDGNSERRNVKSNADYNQRGTRGERYKAAAKAVDKEMKKNGS